MRFLFAAVILCAPWASAQTSVAHTATQLPGSGRTSGLTRPSAAAATPGAPANRTGASTVAPETPVVTLDGLCKTKAAGGECKTVITRADLDRFVRAFSPQAPENLRGRLAVQYARSVAYSALAEQQGLDRNPELAKEIDLQLKMVRMRILATAYLQSVQQKTVAITGAEVQEYYSLHPELFEQAEVRRVAVPFAVPTSDGHPVDHEAVRTEMAALLERAGKGEDLNDLQARAYKDLHIVTAPPQVNGLLVRRMNLQGEEAKVLDLKEGEMSPLLDLPGAFAFVKLVSKNPMALDAVRPEVEEALRRERMENALGKLGTRIQSRFNLDYLGLASQPELFGQGAKTPRPVRNSPNRRAAVTTQTNTPNLKN